LGLLLLNGDTLGTLLVFSLEVSFGIIEVSIPSLGGVFLSSYQGWGHICRIHTNLFHPYNWYDQLTVITQITMIVCYLYFATGD
jgi:hypothetical protein